MKTIFKKALATCSTALVLGLVSTASLAATVYPQLVVDQSSNGISLANSTEIITADRLVGGYREVITFSGNTFQASLLYQARAFENGLGEALVFGSELNSRYGLYAIFTAGGVVSSDGNKTSFTFVPSANDTFEFWLDPNFSVFASKTAFSAPATGATAWNRAQAGDDILLATGKPLTGGGEINCSVATNLCGFFGATTSFSLTGEGKEFFIAPSPFYGLSIQTGQLNGFKPLGTVEIDGSVDAVFAVPEPTSVALLGLGFLGLAFSRRKANK